MNLAEKLRMCRKGMNLSQEQLAEKLCVSRQAVTKWESDKGIPNIESLQALAKLFNVSIEYLLEDNDLVNNEIKESIDVTEYIKTKNDKSIFDVIVKQKYSDANVITPLIKRKLLNRMETVIDFIVHPGFLQLSDALNDRSAYYLVEFNERQLLVNVTKEFMISKELNSQFLGKKKVINQQLFVKMTYTL